jgi:hypothetical protein
VFGKEACNAPPSLIGPRLEGSRLLFVRLAKPHGGLGFGPELARQRSLSQKFGRPVDGSRELASTSGSNSRTNAALLRVHLRAFSIEQTRGRPVGQV